MIYYVLMMLLSILLTGVSHLLLKIGVNKNNTPSGIYINPFSMAGYTLFFMVTICSVFALQGIELKVFYSMTSFNYLVVAGLSRAALKERLGWNKLSGLGLIVIGVAVFNF